MFSVLIWEAIAYFDSNDRLVRWNTKYLDLFPDIALIVDMHPTFAECIAHRGINSEGYLVDKERLAIHH